MHPGPCKPPQYCAIQHLDCKLCLYHKQLKSTVPKQSHLLLYLSHPQITSQLQYLWNALAQDRTGATPMFFNSWYSFSWCLKSESSVMYEHCFVSNFFNIQLGKYFPLTVRVQFVRVVLTLNWTLQIKFCNTIPFLKQYKNTTTSRCVMKIKSNCWHILNSTKATSLACSMFVRMIGKV